MEKETLTDREVLLLRRKLDLLLRTGKLLMESAADTNRIEWGFLKKSFIWISDGR